MSQRKRTEIAELGEFGLIDTLTRNATTANKRTIRGVGDDAAVVAAGRDDAMLVSTDTLLEGIDFDLTYFPLKHLGYKAVTVGVSDILAMNALPEQIMISIGVSAKLPVEALQDLYEGIDFACRELGVDLGGRDTTTSMTGLVINITTMAVPSARLSVTVRERSSTTLSALRVTSVRRIWACSCWSVRSVCLRMWKTPNRSSEATSICCSVT